MRSKHNNPSQRAPTLPDEGFARMPQVCAVMAMSRNTLERRIAAGQFPKPIWISKRIKAWRVEDIRELIATLR